LDVAFGIDASDEAWGLVICCEGGELGLRRVGIGGEAARGARSTCRTAWLDSGRFVTWEGKTM
jgi:hypothetical protein